MLQLISFSGGLGSFMAAHLTVRDYGAESCKLIFCDTKTEDPDLYRFVDETSILLGCEVVRLCDGRTIWEVFTDVRFHGNNRIDPCSRILKRDLFKKYVASNYIPDECNIVVGIGGVEQHRMVAIHRNWHPYTVTAPLIDSGTDRDDILDILERNHIAPPRLYAMGFPHNNCGGFCVKTGQKQMKLLLDKLPEVYDYHEQAQEKLFRDIDSRHGFIRKTIAGNLQYLSLREFRELTQSGEPVDQYQEDGCNCFV
jgi:3'-phosphoadenosine 5'-phosphosulfate sulfotransferase (PAPS reductase)/FAD synthetase